jgi:hypothetical protein
LLILKKYGQKFFDRREEQRLAREKSGKAGLRNAAPAGNFKSGDAGGFQLPKPTPD